MQAETLYICSPATLKSNNIFDSRLFITSSQEWKGDYEQNNLKTEASLAETSSNFLICLIPQFSKACYDSMLYDVNAHAYSFFFFRFIVRIEKRL